jgi:rRNA maturation endonuclease Nob1
MTFDHESLDGIVLVLRCSECGDTFPLNAEGDSTCPSCGSANVDPATEPLL